MSTLYSKWGRPEQERRSLLGTGAGAGRPSATPRIRGAMPGGKMRVDSEVLDISELHKKNRN